MNNDPQPNDQIYGTDTEGNALTLNLACSGKDGHAELWLNLRLVDGVVYSLPAPASHVHSSKLAGGQPNEARFEVAGVHFQCLQPYMKWRISYAGMLRRVGGGGENALDFVKFNFL